MAKRAAFRRASATRPRTRVVKIGDRRILASGLDVPVFGDLYYHAMRLSWLGFFASFAAAFLLVNVIFAFFYSLGDHPVANARPDSFLDLFFFSIETLGTVGYGDMHPQTDYAHFVATVEIFTGLAGLAVVTGLVFTRFSRPRARLIYARHPVVGPHDGRNSLMFRIANQRHNMISEAICKLWVVLEQPTAEGVRFRRFHQLLLERGENPVFVLSWTLFHVIDAASPIFGMGPDDLERADAAFVVTFSGLDVSASQRVNSRQAFSYRDLRWGHRYADVLISDDGDLPRIDYTKFHDTVSIGDSEPAEALARAPDLA